VIRVGVLYDPATERISEVHLMGLARLHSGKLISCSWKDNKRKLIFGFSRPNQKDLFVKEVYDMGSDVEVVGEDDGEG